MNENRKEYSKQVLYAILLFFDIVLVIVSITIQNPILIMISIVLFWVIIKVLLPKGLSNRYRVKALNNRVRYRIHHCDLEVFTYSSRVHHFDEIEHPLDEMYSIDYKHSIKRHTIKASLNEEPFLYHEETLFPKKKIPVTNMFQGYVVEFTVKKQLPKKLTLKHPFLASNYPGSYVYTNGKMLRVYIPNARHIEEIGKQDDIQEKINNLTKEIKEIILFKKEFLMTYKEEQQ